MDTRASPNSTPRGTPLRYPFWEGPTKPIHGPNKPKKDKFKDTPIPSNDITGGCGVVRPTFVLRASYGLPQGRSCSRSTARRAVWAEVCYRFVWEMAGLAPQETHGQPNLGVSEDSCNQLIFQRPLGICRPLFCCFLTGMATSSHLLEAVHDCWKGEESTDACNAASRALSLSSDDP